MKTLVLAVLMTAALAACGSKAKKDTTPSNKADMGSNGSTGGASYGSATTTPQPTKPAADPCNGGGPM